MRAKTLDKLDPLGVIRPSLNHTLLMANGSLRPLKAKILGSPIINLFWLCEIYGFMATY